MWVPIQRRPWSGRYEMPDPWRCRRSVTHTQLTNRTSKHKTWKYTNSAVCYRTGTRRYDVVIADFGMAVHGSLDSVVVGHPGTAGYTPIHEFHPGGSTVQEWQKIDVWCFGICVHVLITRRFPKIRCQNKTKAEQPSVCLDYIQDLQLWHLLYSVFSEPGARVSAPDILSHIWLS